MDCGEEGNDQLFVASRINCYRVSCVQKYLVFFLSGGGVGVKGVGRLAELLFNSMIDTTGN